MKRNIIVIAIIIVILCILTVGLFLLNKNKTTQENITNMTTTRDMLSNDKSGNIEYKSSLNVVTVNTTVPDNIQVDRETKDDDRIVTSEPYEPAQLGKNTQDNKSDNETLEEFYARKDINKVSMSIKKDSITSTGLILIIKDDNEETYEGNENYYRIEKLENDTWTQLEYRDDYIGDTSIGYTYENPHLKEVTINWERKYGVLEPGKYKLKQGIYIFNDYVWFELEFEI